MKIIKEHINFERGISPQKAMNVGIYTPRLFTSPAEFIRYIILVLPIIFDGKIPDDILSSARQNAALSDIGYTKIREFLIKYQHMCYNRQGKKITFDKTVYEGFFDVSWPALIKLELLKMGFKDK